MKCNKCGNEFFAGTVCPNCGNSVPIENASETVAYNEEISVNVAEGTDKNLSEPAVNVYSHGTPQPQEGIFANSGMASQGMYGGQPVSSQNIYNGQPMSGQPMQSQPMSGQSMQSQGMYGGQPMSGQPGQSQGMYGGQPMSAQMFNGGQPISSQMYNNSQSVPGPGMYGYSNTNGTMNEPQKKSKLPVIIAGVTLVVAVVAIILILVFVVFKKDDGGDDDNNVTTTEEGNNGHTNEPSSDTTEPSTDTAEPSSDTTESSTDTTEPATDDNNTGSTPSGEVIFSNDTVEIYYDTAYIDDRGSFVVEGKVKNKGDVKIGMGLDAGSINNVSMEAYLYGSAEANATGDWEYEVEAGSLAVSDLSKITDVDMYFSVYNGETYMDIFVDEMKANCDVEVTTEKVVGKDNWKTVYSDDYCDIDALDCVFEDEFLNGYKAFIRVTNKTDELTTVMVDDSEIDDIDVDVNGGYLCVTPKSTAYVIVYWSKDDVPDSAKKFGEIKLEMEMYSSTNYTSMTDADITFKTTGVVK